MHDPAIWVRSEPHLALRDSSLKLTGANVTMLDMVIELCSTKNSVPDLRKHAVDVAAIGLSVSRYRRASTVYQVS